MEQRVHSKGQQLALGLRDRMHTLHQQVQLTAPEAPPASN